MADVQVRGRREEPGPRRHPHGREALWPPEQQVQNRNDPGHGAGLRDRRRGQRRADGGEIMTGAEFDRLLQAARNDPAKVELIVDALNLNERTGAWVTQASRTNAELQSGTMLLGSILDTRRSVSDGWRRT